MKKSLHIHILSLAISCLLLMTIVPHHHHLMRACAVVQTCEQDGRVNDRHTAHHSLEIGHSFFTLGKQLSNNLTHDFSRLMKGKSPWSPGLAALVPSQLLLRIPIYINKVFITDNFLPCPVDESHHGLRAPPLFS